jgi:hypothetical protein
VNENGNKVLCRWEICNISGRIDRQQECRLPGTTPSYPGASLPPGSTGLTTLIPGTTGSTVKQ